MWKESMAFYRFRICTATGSIYYTELHEMEKKEKNSHEYFEIFSFFSFLQRKKKK